MMRIVLIADQGDALAARGPVAKQAALSVEPVRAPFLACGSGTAAGRAVSGSAPLLDRLSTFADLSGIAARDEMHRRGDACGCCVLPPAEAEARKMAAR